MNKQGIYHKLQIQV